MTTAKSIRLVSGFANESERVVKRAYSAMEFSYEVAIDRFSGRLDEFCADALAAPTPADGDGVDFPTSEHARPEHSTVSSGDQHRPRSDAPADRRGIDGEQRSIENVHHSWKVVGPGGANFHSAGKPQIQPPLMSLSTWTRSASTELSAGTG
jgi:hypothetical protein